MDSWGNGHSDPRVRGAVAGAQERCAVEHRSRKGVLVLQRADPWATCLRKRQSLSAAISALEITRRQETCRAIIRIRLR